MRTAKAVGKAFTLSIDTLVNLFKKIREIAGDIPGYLKMVDGFVDDLIKSFKSNIDILFKKYQAVINLLNDLGVIVTRNIDQNLFPELVAQGLDVQVYVIRNKTPIFSGTDEAFDAFAKKIDEINDSAGGGKKGKEAVGEYLDDIEEVIKKEKVLSNNIDSVIEDLGIEKPRISTLSIIQTKERLKSIISNLSKTRNAFNPNKAALRRLDVKFPKSKVGLSVDFRGSDYLYSLGYGDTNLLEIRELVQEIENNIPLHFLIIGDTITGNLISINLEISDLFGKIYMFSVLTPIKQE